MNLAASVSLLLLCCSIGGALATSLLRSHGSRKLDEGIEVPFVPDLVEDWERIPDYPLDVGEAQGALVGFDLILFGGFLPGFADGSKQTYMLNLKDHYDGLNVDWIQMDDCPVHPYWTHAAHAVKGNQLFFCGGYIYVDENDEFYSNTERDECYIFDKTASPGNQWQSMPFLPEGRAGGGMVYVESMDKLIFALGAVRPDGTFSVVDMPNVYMLDLSNPNADWVELAGAPYTGNHVAAVDAKDCAGNDHYFWLGGQERYLEKTTNIDLMYEYFPETDSWEQRANMPYGTGHASSSVIAYGCGFVMVGGVVDGDPNIRTKTRDVYYYDIEGDEWTEIGDYVKTVKTPVCGIYSDKVYCSTGYIVEGWRSTITFPDIPTSAPTLPSTEAPTSAPSTEATSSKPTFPSTEATTSAPTLASTEATTSAPTPPTSPLWTDVFISTNHRDGDFCPNASFNVRVQIDDVDAQGVPVTLKNDDLGIDMEEITNQWGRAKFAITVTVPDPDPGTYLIEGCAYDAGGTAYCDIEEVEVAC